MSFIKRSIFIFLIVFALILLFKFFMPPKIPVEITEKAEITNTQEFLLTLPDRDDSSSDSVTPNEIIDLVLSKIEKAESTIICGFKDDSTRFEITDREGYRDLSKNIDLNDDGIEEILVMPIDVCGNVIRGASGNGPIYIFQKKDDIWRNIGGAFGNLLRVRYEKTNSYYDIETNYHMSVYSGSTFTYKFQLAEGDGTSGTYQQVSESKYDNSKSNNN